LGGGGGGVGGLVGREREKTRGEKEEEEEEEGVFGCDKHDTSFFLLCTSIVSHYRELSAQS
jgi:hypothetical protein